MGKNEMKKKKPKNLLTVMTSAILLTLCIACFLQVTISARRTQQMPLVLNRFEGSYSYDGIHWQPITEQDMPSAKHNNVVLRGILSMRSRKVAVCTITGITLRFPSTVMESRSFRIGAYRCPSGDTG